WYYLVVTFIAVVGVINAYNFMDGINGITASYSLALSILLLCVNLEIKFINQQFLMYILISLVIFTFFNLRKEAITYAGDVGSVLIDFILIFILGILIIKPEQIIYILFLAVYGIDNFWTIFRRLFLKENIFDAHRSHL